MAIDSRDKRASAIAFVLPFIAIGATPDGDITSEADRQQMAWSYRGIAASDGWVAVGISTGNLQADRMANALSYSGASGASYDEALVAMMRVDLSNDDGDIDELLIRWLNLRLGLNEASLTKLKMLAAADRGVSRWSEIGDLTAIGS